MFAVAKGNALIGEDMKIVLIFMAGLLLYSCSVTDAREEFSDALPRMKEANEQALPDSLKSLYEDAAFFLAARRIMNTPGDTTTVPPAEDVARYYHALLHVFNQTGSVRDSLVERYRIGVFPLYATGDLLVGIDPVVGWTTAWQNGTRLTGNSTIDHLLDRFSLDLISYSADLKYVLLRSPNKYNMIAVGERFEGINGVRYAEPNGSIGDGNNITGEVDQNGVMLTYSVGYGDCPAGCTARRFWDVTVDYTGNVIFLRSYGAPGP